jgi:hypothetical protein
MYYQYRFDISFKTDIGIGMSVSVMASVPGTVHELFSLYPTPTTISHSTRTTAITSHMISHTASHFNTYQNSHTASRIASHTNFQLQA